MRTMVWLGIIGIAAHLGGMLTACSGTDEAPRGDTKESHSGKLSMNLRTTSASGKVYELSGAVFLVDKQGFIVPGGPPGPAGFPTTIDSSSHTAVLRSDDNPKSLTLGTFLSPGSYQIDLVPGWAILQVDELSNDKFFVQADLQGSELQFFDILSDQERFVKYDFLVNGERISFGKPGRLIVGIDVQERTSFCGNGIIDPGEVCDGADLGGQTCASVTLGARPNGLLLCNSFCFFETAFCDGGFGGAGGAGGAGGTGGFGGGFGGGTGGVDWQLR